MMYDICDVCVFMMYVYICMYICICVCVYVCIYICIYVCMYVCMHACMTYVSADLCVCMCTCVYVCMCVYVYMGVCMYACMNLCIYVCMYLLYLRVCLCVYVSDSDRRSTPPAILHSFYNHAHHLRLEIFLYLGLSWSSNGFFKAFLDSGGRFASKYAAWRFQKLNGR
jgi:hypothetical protein